MGDNKISETVELYYKVEIAGKRKFFK